MLTQLKTAITNNIARLLVGAIVTCLGAMVIEPVKEIISVPSTLKEMQDNQEQNQAAFMHALANQQRTDSVLFEEVTALQATTEVMQTEVGTIKTEVGTINTKVSVIQSEFPSLHQRFKDIQDAVDNTRKSNNLALRIPLNTNNNEQTTN